MPCPTRGRGDIRRRLGSSREGAMLVESQTSEVFFEPIGTAGAAILGQGDPSAGPNRQSENPVGATANISFRRMASDKTAPAAHRARLPLLA